MTTPGHTDRFVRHRDGAVFTEIVGSGSDAMLKNDATWKIVPGLANSSCYSFESRNYPGDYLRHREYRVHKESGSGDLFRADATFCPARAANGGVRLSAYNFPEQYLRHYNAELWLATPGGTHTWDNPALFTEDTTWTVESPWAP